MRRWRVRLVNGIIAVIVLAHLMEIARQTEHWPFSNYPMWARVSKGWTETQIVPMGVLADDPGVEIPLNNPDYFAPMPVYYERLNFRRVARKPGVRDELLREYLGRYERRRAALEHAGPALGGIRLYERSWTMDRAASNVGAPERWTLIYEYPPGAKGAGQ
jgi:hypothetical protein